MTRRKLGKAFGWSLLLLVLAALGLATWEPLLAERHVGPPTRHYDGRIVRDEWGVPHLFGPTDADVAYALAYAHAEDDFATLQEVIAMVRGRAGAMLGPDGAKTDYVYHLLDVRGTVDAGYAGIPADVRALLDGYASGLNRYAARHPEEVRLPHLFPVEGKDIVAGFVLRAPFFYGLDATLAALTEDKPLPPESAGPMAARGTLARWVEARSPFAQGGPNPPVAGLGGDASGMNGSNAFAVAPRRSGDGHTRLLSNSHQPWTGQVAWYELSVQSGEGWHFSGANFPGMPFPALGHNAELGWTNTVNRPDLVDVYKLVVDSAGERYRFDGRWRPLRSRRVWLPVRFGPFVLPVPRTVAASVHGPVIVNGSGAYAIHYGGMGTVGQVEQYYRLTKARSWEEWSRIMAMHQIPGTNFIYADRTGRIAHLYNAQFPLRKAGFDYRGVLPGDTSRALAAGSVPWAQVPQHVDPPSGFLENSNNTPFLAAGPGSELDPRRYSPLLGIERDVTNRAERAVRLMAATRRIGLPQLLHIKYDTGYDRDGYAGRYVAALLAADTRRSPSARAAQRLLGGWDWTMDGRGRADALALLLLRTANRWNYKREGALPDFVGELETAAGHLQRHFGRLDPPLGALLRLRRGPVDLPLDGGPDTLRAMALWDLDPDGRARVRHGDSFVMLVDWDPRGVVRSQSVQPFGAATTRPTSPHYADQAPLFARHALKPVHFDPADLARVARRAYRP